MTKPRLRIILFMLATYMLGFVTAAAAPRLLNDPSLPWWLAIIFAVGMLLMVTGSIYQVLRDVEAQ